jgi:branched-chain amino acid transport system ATP-binding protein
MNNEEMTDLGVLIEAIRSEHGVTVVLVAHTMRLVMGICERITVLDHGEVIARGVPDEIAESQAVIDAYLGKADTDA